MAWNSTPKRKRGWGNRFIQVYEIEPELLWALYWGEDLSTEKIGKLFGCNRDTINSKMRRYDIPRRNIKETNNARKIIVQKKELEDE